MLGDPSISSDVYCEDENALAPIEVTELGIVSDVNCEDENALAPIVWIKFPNYNVSILNELKISFSIPINAFGKYKCLINIKYSLYSSKVLVSIPITFSAMLRLFVLELYAEYSW